MRCSMSVTARATCSLILISLLAARPYASPYDGEGPATRGPARAVAQKPGRLLVETGAHPPIAHAQTAGALTGKTVYLSAGHGWHYAEGAWRTQRGNTHDLVEDFITIEGVNEYLIEYLRRMGAYVVPIREADLNPNLVIVDDGKVEIEGQVAEVATQDRGWGEFPSPFENASLQPFAVGQSRLMMASGSETGRAVFSASISEAGYYNVYVSYVQGMNRVPDAHFIVRHAGGESHVRVDERRHGGTWVLLGRWYFEQDGDAAVAVANDSATPDGVISFDAVRFGGGMAQHMRGGATTGRPAFESAAAYSTQLLGAPRDVYDYFTSETSSDDVVARPRFAAWDHETGEDAIYLAWHTNAPSPARGTMSIAFGNTYPCCRGYEDFAGVAGSLQLLDAVHGQLLADLRAAYDPAWRDAGKVTAALGELNPAHNPEMPAILVELAFHDTAADAEALRDPRFRQLAARAMARGVAKYFASKAGVPIMLPPEPPTALRVENAGAGKLQVSWRPPAAEPTAGAAPMTYRVYLSTNGYGFDDGVLVEGESMLLQDLPRGSLRFVRVAAVNDGGESLPTEVVGARTATSGSAPILVVGGFDRLDKYQMIRDAAPLVGTVDRMNIDRMNNGTYAARHGKALADGGFAFDGATDEAVAERDVDLAAYKAIDWFAGQQANAAALPATTRTELERFRAAGGKLMISGSELVWALDTRGTADDQMFVREALHVSLLADDAETYDVTALPGPFGDLAPISFRDTASGGYDATMPDVLVPGAGAVAVLAYGAGDGGASAAAAIAWDDGIVIGFPIELVQGDKARSDLLAAALAYFGVEPDPDPKTDEDPAGDDDLVGCGCGTGGNSSGVLVIVVALVLARRRRR
jgi:MYXO-CTERM domain-containing protein